MLERLAERLRLDLLNIERDEAACRAVDDPPDCVAAAMMAEQVDQWETAD